jgi:hypothetical protein
MIAQSSKLKVNLILSLVIFLFDLSQLSLKCNVA